MPVVILSIVLGVTIFLVGGLPFKWVFVLATIGCFPLLVLGLGSLKKALLALLILSFFMVLDVNLWWSEKYQNINPGFSISLRAIILFALYSLWGFDLSRRVATVRPFLSVTLPFGLLVAWSGFSIIIAPEPSWVLLELPKAIVAFFLFFYVANMLNSPADIRFVVVCVAVAVGFFGALAICQSATGSSFGLQFLGGEETMAQQQYARETLSRVSGFLKSATLMAGILSGLLPLLLAYGLAAADARLRMLCAGSFALGLIALILTFARTGWLSFFIGAALVVGYLMKQKIGKGFREARGRLVILVLAAIMLILPMGNKIFTRLTKDDYATTEARVTLAQDAIKIIHRYPLTGVGLGNSEAVIPDVNPNPVMDLPGKNPLKNDLEPINNAYLLVAAELGIPALALFIWILMVFLRRGIVALRSPDTSVTIFALGLIAGLASIYINSLLNPGNIGWPNFALVWFMGGLLMACSTSLETS